MAKSEENSSGGSVLDWVKGLGLPIASLIASVAFFGIQMQQQAFERKLTNVESGYRTYFERRTPLATSNDALTEMALLQMIGAAFPNVYCRVRADMYKRVDELDVGESVPDGQFSRADQNLLRAAILTNATPESGEFATDFASVLFSRAPAPHACHSDFDGEAAPVPHEQEAAAPGPMASATPTPSADATPGATQGAAPAAPPPVADLRASRMSPRFERGVRFDPSRLTLRPEMYRVYFHVREGGRDPATIDPMRAPLAGANFRVMRDVRVVPASNFPSQGEVRYFGPDQEAAANELVGVLNAQFAGQVTFTARAIGDPLPPQNIEVWVP